MTKVWETGKLSQTFDIGDLLPVHDAQHDAGNEEHNVGQAQPQHQITGPQPAAPAPAPPASARESLGHAR